MVDTSNLLSCVACRLLATLVLDLSTRHIHREVAPSAIFLCTFVLGYPKAVCRGIVHENLNVLIRIKAQGIPLTPERICGTVLENANCSVKSGPQVEWRVEVEMGRKGERLQDTPRSSVQTRNDEAEISIVQITDIHFDPKYAAGHQACCAAPLCCRSDQPRASCAADSATEFGHYHHCDVSLDVVRSALQAISAHKNITMVYMTGDLVAHSVWETNQTGNLQVVRRIAELFREYLGDVPVIPVVGNHETHPVNEFAPYFIKGHMSSAWLYKGFIESWGWSLPESARQTFLKGGYYSFLTPENLRIVVLNTNIYHKYNMWNVLYPVDMNDQLTWLATTLLAAEAENEKVHILSHIPPGNEDTLQVFQREYRNIIDRFEHTITAEFNGHTHREAFTLFYDKYNASRVHNVAHNGGSITPFYNVNPNYRLYKVNPRTWEVNDFESYSYNIPDVLDNQAPVWRKLYSFKQEYGVNSLSPQELGDLATRMMDDKELFDKYFYNHFKGSNKEQYDGARKTKMLCEIMTSEAVDQTHCNLLKKLTSKRKGSFRNKMKEFLRKLSSYK